MTDFQDVTRRNAAGVGRALQDRPGVDHEGDGRPDQQEAGGKEEQNAEDELDPGLRVGRQVGVHDIDPHVVALEVRVTGGNQEQDGEQVPLQLLDEDVGDVEQVSHDYVIGGHQDQGEGEPGNVLSYFFVQAVNSAHNGGKKFHAVSPSPIGFTVCSGGGLAGRGKLGIIRESAAEGALTAPWGCATLPACRLSLASGGA